MKMLDDEKVRIKGLFQSNRNSGKRNQEGSGEFHFVSVELEWIVFYDDIMESGGFGERYWYSGCFWLNK